MVWTQGAAWRVARVKVRFWIRFKVEPTKFTDGLDVGCERKRRVIKDDLSLELKQLEGRSYRQLKLQVEQENQ